MPVRPSFSIGIEEEYQTIDPETRDLRSHVHSEIVQKGRSVLAERVKPEMHQSVVEIGTGVCQNIQEARDEVRMIRQQIITLARQNGLRLAANIRDRWPPVELILTSGHVKIEEGQLPERGQFLPKPYTSAQLSRALKNLHLH